MAYCLPDQHQVGDVTTVGVSVTFKTSIFPAVISKQGKQVIILPRTVEVVSVVIPGIVIWQRLPAFSPGIQQAAVSSGAFIAKHYSQIFVNHIVQADGSALRIPA